MADIRIIQKETSSGWEFDVTVNDGSSTDHKVTLSKDYYKKLGVSYSPKELINKSFQFLLERESKESILSEFDLTKISHYFPEFEEKITS